jgi:hypothetical protein
LDLNRNLYLDLDPNLDPNPDPYLHFDLYFYEYLDFHAHLYVHGYRDRDAYDDPDIYSHGNNDIDLDPHPDFYQGFHIHGHAGAIGGPGNGGNLSEPGDGPDGERVAPSLPGIFERESRNLHVEFPQGAGHDV